MKMKKGKYSIPRLILIFIVSILSSTVFLFAVALTTELAFLFHAKLALFFCIVWIVVILLMWHFALIERYLKWVLSVTRLLYPEDR